MKNIYDKDVITVTNTMICINKNSILNKIMLTTNYNAILKQENNRSIFLYADEKTTIIELNKITVKYYNITSKFLMIY